MAFRVPGAGNFPRHRTVREFRRRHLEEFERMFVEVVQVARFGTLSVDGTKVCANASKRKAMSRGRMRKGGTRLKGELQRLLDRAGAVDAEEDERHGREMRGDQLPEELQRREKRLAAIRQAKARLEAAQREADDARGRGTRAGPPAEGGGRAYKRACSAPESKAQSNFTDPESRIMRISAEGFQQCCNTQLVVDGEHRIIAATEVEANASDQGRLVPMPDKVNDAFGVEPEVALADAGCRNEADLAALERRGIDGHAAFWREDKARAVVDPRICPVTCRMGEKLAGAESRARYGTRKWLSEALNGWIEEVLGVGRFSLRGARKVRSEWHLVCLVLNVRRMAALAA